MEYPSKEPLGVNVDPAEEQGRIESSLEYYLSENAETERRKQLYPTAADEEAAMSLSRPLAPERVFALYGLILGTIPPLSLFILFLMNSRRFEPVVLLLMTLTDLTTAIVGYHTGKLVGKLVRALERHTFTPRMLLLAVMGAVWGAASGFAGGIFLFLIGAIFGAFIGGVVGAVALPAFSTPYSAMKRGELIELKHFLPISLGTALTIAAFVIGSAFR